MDFRQKYLKYKKKYLALKAQMGGNGNLKQYLTDYTEATVKNCTHKSSKLKFCNCPGFLSHRFIRDDDMDVKCTLCSHTKIEHINIDLSFSGITDELFKRLPEINKNQLCNPPK